MAANTKLMQEISDQFLHCKICLESYKEPKTLSCLHTFCLDCIQQHVDTEGSRTRYSSLYNRHVTCPLCRKRTEIPAGGVRRLPDNFLLSNLTEVIDRRRPSKIPPCEICHMVRTRSNEACSKCLDCSKLLCRTCVDMHQNTKVTQNHSLIDVEGEKDIVCKQHQDEIVRFYCEPCDTCICVVCTFQEHRDHEICSFSDGYVKYKSDMESLLYECKTRLELVQDRLISMNNCESVLKETRENIRDLAISYIQQVRSTEREMLKTIDSHLGEKVLDFIQNKESLEENLEGLQSACHLTDIIMRDKGVEMLLLKKQMQNKLHSLLDQSIPDLPDDLKKPLKFIPGAVKFGTLAFNDTSDVNCNEKDIDYINGFGTKTQGIQTMHEELIDSSTTMCQDVNITSSECNEKSKNMKQIGTATEQVSMRDKCTMTKVCSKSEEVIAKPDIAPKQKEVSDKGSQVFSDVGSSSSGICVTCCQNLQSEVNIAASNFDQSPTVQDIIVLNTSERNNKEWRKHRRSLIKSRRVQTELSMSNDSLDEPNLVPARSLSYEGVSNQYKPETKSIALDAIGFPPQEVIVEVSAEKPKTREKNTMTTFKMKMIVPTKEASTYTLPPRRKDFSHTAKPQTFNCKSQTSAPASISKGVSTDYVGQTDKGTTTHVIKCIDSETTMPTINFASKNTWTDILQTCERAMATDQTETNDSSTGMESLHFSDQGIQTKPDTKEVNTNTMHAKGKSESTLDDDKESSSENRKSWHGSGFFSKLFRGKGSKDGKGSHDGLNQSFGDMSETSLAPLSPSLVDASTETLLIVSNDKETGTDVVPQHDRWTLTPTPVLINTGISPARPATMETGVETTLVSSMDQGTYTEVVEYKDSTTETVSIVQDNETLTEKIKLNDAQTFTVCNTITSETNTDQHIMVDSFMSTDENLYDRLRPDMSSASTETFQLDTKDSECSSVNNKGIDSTFNSSTPCTQDRGTMALSFGQTSSILTDIETQTADVKLVNRSAATSFEYLDDRRPIESCDMATSTESLPYIGLLSELEGDELFLIPESAFDLATPERSVVYNDGEHLEMVDDATTTDSINVVEMSTQTPGSGSAVFIEKDIDNETEVWNSPTRHVDGKELVDAGVNTLPKLTFEKETTTPIRHLFSKGTMTFYIAKTDKSTCTFSNTRQIAESIFGGHPPVDKCNKVTMTNKDTKMIDASTSTDSSISEGKMAACITKLRNVSERLQSPTSKTMPDLPWEDTANTLQNTNGKNPKEQKSPLPKRTISGEGKQKREGRKAQPITTLKGKKLTPPDMNQQYHDSTEERKPMPSPSLQSKLPRYSTSPGRIATVPNQAMKHKQQTTPKLPPSKIPVHKSNEGPLCPIPSPSVRPKIPKAEVESESKLHDFNTQNSIKNTQSEFLQSRHPKREIDPTLDLSSLKIPHKPLPLPPTEDFPQIQNEEAVRPKEKYESLKDDPKKKSRTVDKKPGSNVGFMQKIFSKKKKVPELGPQKPESMANVPKQYPKPNYLPPEKKAQKQYKPRPFVYLRQRIVSIQHDTEDEIVETNNSDSRPVSGDGSVCSSEEPRPISTYDNL